MRWDDFDECDDVATRIGEQDWLRQAYEDTFYGLRKIEVIKHSERPELQHAGIDKILYLSSGSRVCIEEKIIQKRSEYSVEYPHFSLMMYRQYVDKQGEPVGKKRAEWIEQDLACDYIAYIFEVTRKVYFLPYHLLKVTWEAYKAKFELLAGLEEQNYKLIWSGTKTKGGDRWKTCSCGVPKRELFKHMYETQIWSPETRKCHEEETSNHGGHNAGGASASETDTDAEEYAATGTGDSSEAVAELAQEEESSVSSRRAGAGRGARGLPQRSGPRIERRSTPRRGRSSGAGRSYKSPQDAD